MEIVYNHTWLNRMTIMPLGLYRKEEEMMNSREVMHGRGVERGTPVRGGLLNVHP